MVQPGRIERDVDIALRQALGIPVGFTVTEKPERARGQDGGSGAQAASPSCFITATTAGRAFMRAKCAAQFGGNAVPMREEAQNST